MSSPLPVRPLVAPRLARALRVPVRRVPVARPAFPALPPVASVVAVAPRAPETTPSPPRRAWALVVLAPRVAPRVPAVLRSALVPALRVPVVPRLVAAKPACLVRVARAVCPACPVRTRP